MIGMRKWSRAAMAVVLSVALMGGYIPKGEIHTYGSETKEKQVVYRELPEEETTMIEVFNKNGSMKKVSMDVDEYEKAHNDAPDMELKSDIKAEDNLPKGVSGVSPAPSAGAYNFAYKDLVNNGSDGDNYCILIAGDGYTANEQDKFLQIAQNIANYFMSRSPFNESGIKNKINIRAVCVTSNESGVSLDPTKPFDTFFATTFNNNGIERLIWAHNSKSVWEIVNQYMPDCQVPIIVGNSTKYGGAGGSYCTISANESSSDIAFHEFGHTGGSLADEYWESTTDSTNRREAPNRTSVSDPTKCKWSDLVGVNGVGLYEFDEAAGWYRPHQSCEMRYLNREFCEVCKRQIRYKIKSVIENAVSDNEVIYNADQLKSYCSRVAAGASTTGKTVTLANDITLSGTDNISVMKKFNGTFNGNGHIIRGIHINSSEGTTGLIGELGSSASVLNLAIESANITGDGYYVGGIVGNNKGTIYGCSFNGQVQGKSGTGGIAGNNSGTIHDCYNLGTVHSTAQVSGGIIGWMEGGTMYNCFNYGKITVGNSWYGGVCGYNPGGTVSSCYFLEGTAGEGVAGQGSTTAVKKTAAEFSNGSVTSSLNAVNAIWKQGASYPVFTYTSTPIQQETTTAKTYNGFVTIEAEDYSYMSGGVIDNNSSASGGHNIGGVVNGVYTRYDNVSFSENASSIKLYYSSKSGQAQGNAEIYVDNFDNKVGTVTLPNTGSNWSDYSMITGKLEKQISRGTHTVYIKFVTTGSAGYVANVDYFTFIKASEETTVQPDGPIEVFGLMLTSERNNMISVVWGQNEEQIAKGQKYNVYVDGSKKLEQVGCGQYDIEGITSGTHTVKVTAVLDGKETAGISGEIVVNGSTQIETTTQAPTEETTTEYTINDGIEVNGCQISTVSQGVRTIYSVESKIKGKEVVESGLVYSIADYVGENELYVGSESVYVQNFRSTQNGLCGTNFSGSKTASSYAMTVQFYSKTAKEYNANWRVKAYAKLSDGSYVYTKAVDYSIFNIADTLYQNSRMGTEAAHNYLYDNILKIVNSNYLKKDFNHNNSLVK